MFGMDGNGDIVFVKSAAFGSEGERESTLGRGNLPSPYEWDLIAVSGTWGRRLDITIIRHYLEDHPT